MGVDVRELLGDEADSLLKHESRTIERDKLVLPGPDFIDRVFTASDRPIPVLRNLEAMYRHGRLGGTGYLSIFPVDQGIEHSAAASFAKNPDLLRSGGDRRARHRGAVQRRRHHARRPRYRRQALRAQDPLHLEAQPQRAAHLPREAGPGALRPGAPGGRPRRYRRRRHDLLRLGGVDPPDPGSERDVRRGAPLRLVHRALVLPAQSRLQDAGGRLPPSGGPHRAGEPPRRDDRGRHHQAEAAGEQRRLHGGGLRARPTPSCTPS